VTPSTTGSISAWICFAIVSSSWGLELRHVGEVHPEVVLVAIVLWHDLDNHLVIALAHHVVIPVQVAIVKLPGYLGKLTLEALHHLWRFEYAPEHETCFLWRLGDSYMDIDQPSIYTTI
jgi:hypothetical protein